MEAELLKFKEHRYPYPVPVHHRSTATQEPEEQASPAGAATSQMVHSAGLVIVNIHRYVQQAGTFRKVDLPFGTGDFVSVGTKLNISPTAPAPTPSSSAFSELEELRSDDRLVRQIISGLRTSGRIRYKDRLADRLEELLEAYKDDYEGRVLSAESLSGLVEFLSAHSQLKCPTITATPGGDLYAKWKRDNRHLLSVHFLWRTQARFVIFKANPMHPVHTEQFTGTTTTDALLNAVAPHDVLTWAAE